MKNKTQIHPLIKEDIVDISEAFNNIRENPLRLGGGWIAGKLPSVLVVG